MGGAEPVVHGVVRNGAIVLDDGARLPEGVRVTIVVHAAVPASEAEVAQLSEEAVKDIDQWERQE